MTLIPVPFGKKSQSKHLLGALTNLGEGQTIFFEESSPVILREIEKFISKVIFGLANNINKSMAFEMASQF